MIKHKFFLIVYLLLVVLLSSLVFASSFIPFDASDINVASIPSSFDLREEGWVTPIKDQFDCGSCTAFAVNALLESRARLDLNNSKYAINLSEQYLVSCSNVVSCFGGLPGPTLNFITTEGVVHNRFLEYHGTQLNVGCDNFTAGKLSVDEYFVIVDRNPKTIKYALVNYGPVVGTIEVHEDFEAYSDGIYSYSEGDFLYRHSVLLIGYNDSGNYWIFKNSWGEEWGEEGFFKLDYDETFFFNVSIHEDLRDHYDFIRSPLNRREIFPLGNLIFVKDTNILKKPVLNNVSFPKSVDWFEEFNLLVEAYPSSVKYLKSVSVNGLEVLGDSWLGDNFSSSIYPFELGCKKNESICSLNISVEDDAGFVVSKSSNLSIDYAPVGSNINFINESNISSDYNMAFVIGSNNELGEGILQYSLDDGDSWWVFNEPVGINYSMNKILFRVVDIFGETEEYNEIYLGKVFDDDSFFVNSKKLKDNSNSSFLLFVWRKFISFFT